MIKFLIDNIQIAYPTRKSQDIVWRNGVNAYGNGQYATQSNSQRGGHNENGQIPFGNFHNQIGYGFSTDPQPDTSRDYQQQPFQGQHPLARSHTLVPYHIPFFLASSIEFENKGFEWRFT